MQGNSYTIKACWDTEAKVYYSESDIKGLHIETSSIDEFEKLIFDLAPSLILANHNV